MKKATYILFLLATQMGFSQYMIVGKDSISVQKFVKENQFGLENAVLFTNLE